MEIVEAAKKVMEEHNAVLAKLEDENNGILQESEPVKPLLPNLNQKLAEYKRQLKDMSKNELVRYCADVYVKATVLGFENQDLKSHIQHLEAQKGENHD